MGRSNALLPQPRKIRRRASNWPRWPAWATSCICKWSRGQPAALEDETLHELRELAAFIRGYKREAFVADGIGIQTGLHVARLAEAGLGMVVVGTTLVDCMKGDRRRRENCLEELAEATRTPCPRTLFDRESGPFLDAGRWGAAGRT